VNVDNAEVAEEHIAPQFKFNFSFEEVSDDDEDVSPQQPVEEPHRFTAEQLAAAL